MDTTEQVTHTHFLDRPGPECHGCGHGPGPAVPQAVVPTAWQDEALARDGVSREVPCSALKGETVPDHTQLDEGPETP